ncbi:MAG: molybdenum cofactor guanylyltransferase [Deltaproteobacteria bacterium]|nr:molybdenum cofactor guanylyltransferase [Deltaproteobacteria bacterium]
MTGAILVGGKSRRMGFNKAFIKVNGRTIIEGAIETLRHTFSHLIVVASSDNILEYEHLNITVFADVYAGAGSLGGIYTALFHSPSPYCFVAACDMPLLDSGIINRMVNEAKGHDAVIPSINGRFHPLHAIYSRRCMTPMEEMIRGGDLTIGNLYQRINVKGLDEEFFHDSPALPFLTNLNTTDQLKELSEPPQATSPSHSRRSAKRSQ